MFPATGSNTVEDNLIAIIAGNRGIIFVAVFIVLE